MVRERAPAAGTNGLGRGWEKIVENEIEYQKTAKNAGEDCGCEIKVPSALSN